MSLETVRIKIFGDSKKKDDDDGEESTLLIETVRINYRYIYIY